MVPCLRTCDCGATWLGTPSEFWGADLVGTVPRTKCITREIAMIPKAKLAIECAMINPPKPIGCGVMIDGKLAAVVSLEELKRAAARLEELQAARR